MAAVVGGGRLLLCFRHRGDSRLAVPHLLHPVAAEFRAAGRAARVAGALPALAGVSSVPAPAPIEDAGAAARQAACTLPAAYLAACAAARALAADPGVACSVASHLEGLCGPGLDVRRLAGEGGGTTEALVWTADHGLQRLCAVGRLRLLGLHTVGRT